MNPYLVLCNAPAKKDDVEVEVWADDPFTAIQQARSLRADAAGFARFTVVSLAPRTTGECRL